MASHINNRGKAHGKGWRSLNWGSDVFIAVPLTDRYTPDPDHASLSDVRAYAVNGGSDYDTVLSNLGTTINNGSDMVHHTADDVTISGVSGSDIAGLQVAKALIRGSDTNNTCLTWVEFSSTVDPGGADLTPEFPGGRVFNGT